MGDERIQSVPKELVRKLEKSGKEMKWVKPAKEIKEKLENGDQVVGYYIGLPDQVERSAEINLAQSCLTERLRGKYHHETRIYSKARYIPEESELKQGWWIFFSLHAIN